MKSFKGLLALFVAILMVTACQKEAIEETVDLSSREAILAHFADEIDAYVEEHGNVKMEYSSLEDLNETFIKHGLIPITLEEVGVSQEEYEAAQNRMNNPEVADDRCSGNLAKYFGDVNGNGRLDNDDIARFRIGLNGTRLPFISTGAYSRFGYISAVWNFDGNPSSGANDGNVAVQIVLGVRPCM